jgi:hypothetical protein
VLARRGDRCLERTPSIRAEPLEACKLRLHRDTRRPRGLDRRAAVTGDGLGREPPPFSGVGGRRRLGLDRDRPQT